MKINSKETIAGYPILKIRDLLRYNRGLNELILENALKISANEARRVLQEMVALGLIEKDEEDMDGFWFLITLQGNSLGNAKAIPSISRAKADVLFEKFMLRVKEVNKNPQYLYKISRVDLFGSYITNAETINDIDIGYKLEKKGRDRDKWRVKDRQQVRKARHSGVNFNSFMDDLFYTRRIVQKYLKSRSPYISLHDLDDDGIFEIIETMQVFPATRNSTK